MGRLVRSIIRKGQDSDVWPLVLLLFAVLVPAACLLWFMGAAMRNERLAARQKLADAYRVQLSTAQRRLGQCWNEMAAEFDRLAATTPAPTAFALCVQSGLVDSAVIFDELGRVVYPKAPSGSGPNRDFGAFESKWQEASHLEEIRNYREAAKRFDEIARETTNAQAAARALQAEARCLVQAGQSDVAIELVDEVLGRERYRHAADRQGRLIPANAELLALELSTNRAAPAFQSIARRLAARLRDYDNPVLAAPQRRFLMKELQRLSLQAIEFPTLAAEDLAAKVVDNNSKLSDLIMPQGQDRLSVLQPRGADQHAEEETPKQAAPSNRSEDRHSPPQIPFPVEGRKALAWQRSALPGLWQFATPSHRVVALCRSDKVLAAAADSLALDDLRADVTVTLAPPDADAEDAFVLAPAGEEMPGWRLVLSLKDREFLEARAGRQTALYLWTAMLVVAGMGGLTVLAARVVRRQMTLARLKNDLTATVSHELKTPLASMRVLVETLLDAEKLDEQKTREYLRLISQENGRLGRLIQNFLTFSRMERKKHTFHFSLLPAGQIVESAVESARGRLEGPGCRFEVQIEDNLPAVRADRDALTTALTNLLENAYKYSEEAKRIVLRARAENGSVMFSVTDNGIGIGSRERRRIFQPFYQVDQRLSRPSGGCGLGLSIVQFIMTAHGGCVSVESQPGCGSTFTIRLPAAAVPRGNREAKA